MRKALPLLFLFALACGEKKPPEPSAEAEPEAEAEAAPEEVVEAEESEPELPPPPPPQEPNADLNVAFTFADGSTKSGHVKRIERGSDWYAEMGWEDGAAKTTLELEGHGTLRDTAWSEIKLVTSSPGKVPDDVDCTYSSETTPWMYTCELRTPTQVKDTEGKTWAVNTRHKWRFTYDDDSTVEFYLVKYPVRVQDTERVSLEDEMGENYDLYSQLQDQLRQDVKNDTLVKSIKITSP